MISNDMITDKDLKDASDKVKSYYTNWMTLITEAISKDKDWKAWTNKPCTENNARNIAAGTIKGQQHRRIYMRCVAKLIEDAMQENKRIKSTLEKVSVDSEPADERSVANQAQ